MSSEELASIRQMLEEELSQVEEDILQMKAQIQTIAHTQKVDSEKVLNMIYQKAEIGDVEKLQTDLHQSFKNLLTDQVSTLT